MALSSSVQGQTAPREPITSINEAPFLTEAQKRDIFYNNAARFLRLEER